MNRALRRTGLCWLLLCGLLLSFGGQTEAQDKQKKGFKGLFKKKEEAKPALPDVALPTEWVKPFTWRCIGPANMGGRITSISVYEADPSIYYLATASGGLLKTINNGVTFEHQFDKEATVSLGAVCVAPLTPNIVWVGTGEANPRNSVSYGDGVYKSTDGGKSWRNMGLKDSYQIGAIVIHPTNPDIVYVGALGRLYGPHPERGVFKTTDGGVTWEKVLFINDRTGIIDMQMHPTDPDTLLVAAWERLRDGFDSYLGEDLPEGMDRYDPIHKGGKDGGIFKTTDGGKTFRKLTTGLPSNPTGRIGLDYYRKDPNVVYAIVDCQKIGMGTPPKKVVAGLTPYMGILGEDANPGTRLTMVTPDGPAANGGLLAGDIILTLAKGKDKKKIADYAELLREVQEHQANDKLKFTVQREQEKLEFEVTLGSRPMQKGGGGGGFGPGGPKPNRPYHAYYGGQKENLHDKQGPDSHEYGGLYRSADGGDTWTRINSVNPRPMYFSVVRVDPNDEKYLYVLGINLFRSKDGGKNFTPDGNKNVHADQHALWINPKNSKHMVVGTDGGTYVTYDRMDNWDHLNHLALAQFYHVAVCTKRPYWVYGGLQDNGSWGGPSLGQKGGLGPINEDWVSVAGGDGFVCRVDPNDPDLVYYESQDGKMARRNLRTGEGGAITPPQRKKGDPPYWFNWNTPFILSSHNSRIYYCAGQYVFKSIKQGEDLKIISPQITLSKRGTGTALAESPRNPDVLWVGTDDGALWITQNGGKDWTNVTEKVGLPGPRWVATIEASRFEDGRAYVAFDAHRSDDDKPYLYVTEDFGQTWKNITANLPPRGSTRCLREDVKIPNLLYCGTEFSVFVSSNRGGAWTRLNNNLPTVAVHEIAVHPTAGEIVAATHGRSLWILDVTPLQQMTSEAMHDKTHLFTPKTATRWQVQPRRGGTNRRFVGQNASNNAFVYYSLKDKANQASLRIVDVEGTTVAKLTAPMTPGLHKVSWDLFVTPTNAPNPQPPKDAKGEAPKAETPKAEAPKEAPKADVPRGQFGGGQFGQALRRFAPPGSYRVILTVDGREISRTFQVERDPNAPVGRIFADEEEIDLEND